MTGSYFAFLGRAPAQARREPSLKAKQELRGTSFPPVLWACVLCTPDQRLPPKAGGVGGQGVGARWGSVGRVWKTGSLFLKEA